MNEKILRWLAAGQIGSSSKAMAACIAGIEITHARHPHDPADFNHCLMFLDAVPEAREHLYKVSELSEYWTAIISNFEQIECSFIDEVGLDWSKGKHAPITHKLMKSILHPIEDNDPNVIRFGDVLIST